MRKLLTCIVGLVFCLPVFGQRFTEASDLTIVGKVFPDTPNPYERMDFSKYGGWTQKDRDLLEMPSGIIVSFKTNSSSVWVKPEFNEIYQSQTSGFSARGFDLYIKKDGKWLWAGTCAYGLDIEKESGKPKPLVEHMDGSLKECMMYLPTYSKLISLRIGVDDNCTIEKGDVPFRHRVCIHGSSYMHGQATGRAGQTVPGYLTRLTGIQFCSLGVSGDCKMQPQFANALKDADVDAFVFDSFSNGTAETVHENLFAFIETIQAAKPGVPLIFMRTIWSERRNFDEPYDEIQGKKAEMADSLMKVAIKKYKDVYFITTSNATSGQHDTSVDGVHPGSWGYYLWADSVRKPILKILRKYGIK